MTGLRSKYLEKKSKAETFIGFSLKARALTTGTDAVTRLKRAYLILLCSQASENTVKTAKKTANRFHCPIMLCYKPLEEVCNKINCKMAAVTDKNLAAALIDNGDEYFSVCVEGDDR